MHVQNRKAKSVKQRRREKRKYFVSTLLALLTSLPVSVCVLLGFSWVPELPPLYPPAFNILPLQHRTPWRRPKPPETRITALASYTEEAFFLFSHSTHQKSVQKGEEKKRRGNAASHHQIFSVLNLHTRSILLCLFFATVGKCGFAFVLHWPTHNKAYEMWDISFKQHVSRLFHRTWRRAVWYKRTSFRGIQSWLKSRRFSPPRRKHDLNT